MVAGRVRSADEKAIFPSPMSNSLTTISAGVRGLLITSVFILIAQTNHSLIAG